jgi:hypothetical protein
MGALDLDQAEARGRLDRAGGVIARVVGDLDGRSLRRSGEPGVEGSA